MSEAASSAGLFGVRRPRQFFKRPKRDDCKDEARKLFEKKYHFSPGDWALPENASLFTADPWSIKQLQVLKCCLNFHKSQLNDFPLEQWSQHTRRRNPAGDVAWRLRTHINPEFHTQAWSKFFECARTYGLVARDACAAGRLASLHLCEAPGAFVTSLNHYLQLRHPDLQWEWTASTLNPYYEGNSPSNMISDDRFMAHTLLHWCFGEDGTGDIMRWENSQQLVTRSVAAGHVMLVTADGSIDCLERPDAQEEITSPLHYCEVVTALQALGAGGTFVCKLFTMFEHSTVNLLYLLNVVFGEVNIFKPVTSRGGNSEVYAVCLHYAGPQSVAPYIDSLKAAFGTALYKDKSLFPLDSIPKDFIEQVEHCAGYFSSVQCNVIDDNLNAFLMKDFHSGEIRRLRGIVADEFMRAYDVRPIPLDKEILQGLLHEDSKINTNPRDHRGSYTERAHYGSLSIKEKCDSLSSYFESNPLEDWVTLPKDKITWYSLFDGNCDLKLEFTYGRPVSKLKSSKFVFLPILKIYQRLMEEADFESMRTCPNGIKDVEELGNKYDVSTVRWKVVTLPDVNLGYDSYNSTCLKLIIDALSSLEGDGTLYLPNFEVLTHFCVGVLYVLCTVHFQSAGFTDGAGLILGKFVSGHIDILREILRECESGDEGRAVLRVLPVQTTNFGDFYDKILFYNNTLYRNKSTAILSNLKMVIYDL